MKKSFVMTVTEVSKNQPRARQVQKLYYGFVKLQFESACGILRAA